MQKTAFALAALFLLVPSLPILALLPLPIIPALLGLLTLFLYAILQSESFKPILTTGTPAALLIAALSITALFNHQPIPSFLVSGWNAMLKPLMFSGLLPLLTPMALGFTIWCMRTTGHPWPQINRFALALFTCLLMWPDGAADLPALGLLILSVTLLLTRQRINPAEIAACILLLTALATARAVFIYIPALIAFSLLAVWPKRAAIVFGASTTLLYLLNVPLPNLPANLLTPLNWAPELAVALILLVIVTIQSIYHWRWWPAPQHAAWGLGAPMLVIALANLAETQSLAQWYGANYLTPALPVILHSLLRPNYKL